LRRDEEIDLFATLVDIGFWALPAQVDNTDTIVLDGTDWLIEGVKGVKGGKCHVVSRYSSPLTDVVSAQFLTNIAKLKPYSDDKRK